jgi:endothelin-converting enzyme/putative endopeptidase
VKAFDDMVKKTPMADWRTYLRFHVAHSAAPYLSSKFVDEDFAFKRALTGAAKNAPRWKRCVRLLDAMMGEAVGQSFVENHFGKNGKQTTRGMIEGIESSMKKNLDALSWMDDPTRAKALDKLGKIANKIGYPDKWRNYDALTIEPGKLLGNVSRAEAFEVHRQLAKIGKPVDRSEWFMSPPTVNAYYDPSLNEMVFPAGILQPPFYANNQTLPTNFGGIGMVMGHELTHGFDDEGRQFDGDGNLREWWTAPVSAEFERRAACVASQYDEYKPVDDVHVNGKLTLGENIADLGGVKLSLAAYRAANAGQPKSESQGFTEDQQFFLGFAQGWCTNIREEALRTRLATDPHSPARYRVIGPLSNTPDFATAFSCKEGDPMVRPTGKRCEIW